MNKTLKELILNIKIGEPYFVKHKDKYNQTVRELEVIPTKKEFKIGSFTWTKNVVSKSEFDTIVELLKLMDYKEVK